MQWLGVAILVVFGGLILGFLWLGFYARRGEGSPDRPGEFTTVSFVGGDALLAEDEVARMEEEGLSPGRGTLAAVLATLRAAGVPCNEPGPDDPGWGAHIGDDDAQSYLILGEVEEDRWLLVVLDPSSGGPGRSEHLGPLHDALRALPELSDIRWLPRGADAFDEGADRPWSGEPRGPI